MKRFVFSFLAYLLFYAVYLVVLLSALMVALLWDAPKQALQPHVLKRSIFPAVTVVALFVGIDHLQKKYTDMPADIHRNLFIIDASPDNYIKLEKLKKRHLIGGYRLIQSSCTFRVRTFMRRDDFAKHFNVAQNDTTTSR